MEGKTNDDANNDDDSNKPFSRNSSRSFSRKWTLPDDVDEATVTSELRSDGVLKVTANRRKRDE